MVAGQTGYGTNGKQNFMFQLDDMYLTQGSWQYTYSHDGTYAMDFQGYGNGHRIYNCPYYAPFDCHCVAKWGSTSPMVVWQSDNEVNFIDGSVGYACIGFVHDDNVNSIHVGDTKHQGDVIGHTGTYGVGTGDHVHIEAKKGTYDGYHQNSYGIWMLTNSTWLYNLMGCNDTVMTHDYYVNHQGTTVYYNWRNFIVNNPQPTPPTPTFPKRKKFPWFLITSKKLHRM